MTINQSNLKPWIIKTIKQQNIDTFSEIQQKTFDLMNKRHNVVGVSSTGTGKTLAFLIPILNQIELNNKTQVIIFNPTRELAQQTFNKIKEFKKNEDKLSTYLITGGEDVDQIISKLNRVQPQILVVTPTKFTELLKSKKIKFNDLKSVVLDEADMLMDLDFWKDLDVFFSLHNNNYQKSAWSATLHEKLRKQLAKHFTNTDIVTVGESIYINKKINHHIIQTNNPFNTLNCMINQYNFYLCLIFCNTKKEVNDVFQFLLKQKKNVICMHGDLTKRERAKNYREIKKLKYQFIVASDLASRGIDIDGASHVISWNLPNTLDWYIHRSGRCGRGKYSGSSYIIYDGKNKKSVDKLIEKGIQFYFSIQKNNRIIPLKTPTFYRKENKLKKEIKSNIINEKDKKIKPNYKKKMALKKRGK